MATPAITPSAPAAAAPAPAAPSAPVPASAPVAPPPAAAAPPASAAPPVAAAPTAPAGPQPPAAPVPADFYDAREWVEAQAAHSQAMADFKSANPDWKEPAAAPAAAEVPAPGDAPAAEVKPGDETVEPFTLEDEPAVTPQSLNDMLQGDEAIKAAVEANPKVRNALHKLARENAELSQFKGIFPNKDSATFAKKTADRTVALRSQFQRAETPELMASAFDNFMQEFAVMGPDGKQMMDDDGQPVYGDDFYGLTEHVIDRYAGSTLTEVETRLAEDKYTSPGDKTRDQDLQTALKIIKEDLTGEYESPKADYSALPEPERKRLEAREAELKTREDALNGKRTEAQKAEHKQKVDTGNKQYLTDISKRTFDQIQDVVKDFRAKGAVLPDWQLLAAAPGSKTPIFYQNVANEIESIIKADPYTVQSITELEMRPPTPENQKARVEFFDRILKDNIRTVVKKLVRGFATQQVAAAQNTPDTAPNASVEPRSQSAPKPQVLTKEQAYAQAKTELEKTHPGWENETPSQQMALQMTLANRKLNQR